MPALRWTAGLASLTVAALTAFAFYDRYWLWRHCFNELGRCWDSATEQVYLEQAGEVWGGLTGLFLLLALALLWPRRRRSG